MKLNSTQLYVKKTRMWCMYFTKPKFEYCGFIWKKVQKGSRKATMSTWKHIYRVFWTVCRIRYPKTDRQKSMSAFMKNARLRNELCSCQKNGKTQNFQMSLRRPWRYWWSILRYGQDSPPFARKNSLLIQCPPVCLFCLFVHVTCCTALECNCYYFIAFVILLLSHETSENDGRFEIVSIRWPSFKWSELKNWCTLMHSLKRFPGTTRVHVYE